MTVVAVDASDTAFLQCAQCFPSIVILGALHFVHVYGNLTSSASQGTCE